MRATSKIACAATGLRIASLRARASSAFSRQYAEDRGAVSAAMAHPLHMDKSVGCGLLRATRTARAKSCIDDLASATARGRQRCVRERHARQSVTKNIDLAIGVAIVGLIATALWQLYSLAGFKV
jgi:hypothetical protein